MAKNQFVQDPEFLARMERNERIAKADAQEAKERRAQDLKRLRDPLAQIWIVISILTAAVLYLLFR